MLNYLIATEIDLGHTISLVYLSCRALVHLPQQYRVQQSEIEDQIVYLLV